MLIIDGDTVHQCLLPLTCIEAMTQAMIAVSDRRVRAPARTIYPLFDHEGLLVVMQGCTDEVVGAKIVSVLDGNSCRGKPAVQGGVLLFRKDDGTPIALVDGAAVTTLRTAATSALASKVLARPDARTHGVLGAGVQAKAHIDAVAAAFPDVERVVIWARDPGKARLLAGRFVKGASYEVVCASAQSVAAGCDIVSATTSASTPVLFGADVRPGTHINLVGAFSPNTREADSDCVRKARIFVDAIEASMAEAGDIIIPMNEGAIHQAQTLTEIGSVLSGRDQGRSNSTEITLYKSVGLLAQDIYAAAKVFEIVSSQMSS